MNNIKIFYGPKEEFKKEIPEEDKFKTLTEMAIESDAKRREFIHRIQGAENDDIEEETINIENLVGYSEEYSGLNEHVIHNFLSFLSRFNINNLFLQNPPINIVNQFENSPLEADE